jgi:hypothetical protein
MRLKSPASDGPRFGTSSSVTAALAFFTFRLVRVAMMVTSQNCAKPIM